MGKAFFSYMLSIVPGRPCGKREDTRDASGSQDHTYIQVPKGAASGGDQRPTESASEPERHLIPNHSTILTAIKSNVLATSRTKMIQSFIFFFGTTRKKGTLEFFFFWLL